MKHFPLLLTLALLLGGCGASKSLSEPAAEPPVKTDGYLDTTEGGAFTIQHVDMSDGDKMPYRNFQEYLQSHVTGVDITSSGGIVIRGMGTFNGSSDPLILMDGLEIQDTDSINPNDIHSIDVIKDGGTATYGLRGANGVILITSKAAYQAKQAERDARKKQKEADKAARKAAKEAKKK